MPDENREPAPGSKGGTENENIEGHSLRIKSSAPLNYECPRCGKRIYSGTRVVSSRHDGWFICPECLKEEAEIAAEYPNEMALRNKIKAENIKRLVTALTNAMTFDLTAHAKNRKKMKWLIGNAENEWYH